MRLGELSVLVAPSGMGKSTFVRTLISEAVPQDIGVLVALSEEDTDTFHLPIAENFSKIFGGIDKANELLKKLFYVQLQELEREKRNVTAFIQEIEKLIVSNDITFFVFDNFTTSFFNRISVDAQAEAIEEMKLLAQRLGIVFLLVVHTAKGTDPYKGLITGEDARGNATATNIGTYNYVLTTFFRLDRPRTFVFVDKSRHHDKAHRQYYEVEYCPEMKIFHKDRRANVFDVFYCMRESNQKGRK